MSFLSEIEKRSSYRDVLVRISVRRDMTDQIAIGAFIQVPVPPGPVLRVFRDGVEMTRGSLDSLADMEWDIETDGTGSYVSMNYTDAPGHDSTIVVEFALTYATDKINTYVDPEDDTTQFVRWEPRVLEAPEVGTYLEDILAGVLSIADTSVSIADTDNVFKDYLTINDSLRNAPVTFWGIVNGTENIRKLYTGVVIGLARDEEGIVTINVADVIQTLNQPAFMGEPASKAYWMRQLDSFPNMYPPDSGLPIKLILGSSSRFKLKLEPKILWGAEKLDVETLERAVLTSYSATGTQYIQNRTWGLCRTLDGLVAPGNFSGTASSHSSLGNSTGYTIAEATVLSMGCKVGDHYRIVSNSVTHYGRIVRIDDNGSTRTLWFETTATTTPSFNTSVTLTGQKVSIIFKRGDVEVPLFETKDYTLGETTLDSGNKYHYITLVNNFESNHVIPGTSDDIADTGYLDPSSDQLFFRLRPATTNLGHAEVLKRMCETVGMEIDTDEFTAAQNALDVNTYFSIPTSREDDYDTYLKYAEQICKSTMGFLTSNKDGQIYYRLIESSQGGSVFDENTSSFKGYQIDYTDIVTGIIAINQDDSEQGVFIEDAQSEYLHNIKNVIQFYHVLEDISDRLQDILDVRKQRKVIYTHTVPHTWLGTEVGDEATIENDELMGGVGSAEIFITGIRKTLDETTVESTDLGGF